MVFLGSSAFALMLVGLVNAVSVKRQEDITPLSPSQISSFTPFTYFASAAYCKPSTTINWSCGANCQANSDFVPVASGGDGAATQFWYVGFSPSQKTVIVAHQGTDPDKFLSELTEARFLLTPLNAPESRLFPDVPYDVKVQNGFALFQASTASKVLSAVKQTLTQHSASSVTVVGHGLGAAIALIDGVYLHEQLGKSASVRVVAYGMPRVGNLDFAEWVDLHLYGQVTHINNMKDPIPIVPDTGLGYRHTSGEVHITDPSTWKSCPGEENPSNQCIVGAVPTIFEGNLKNHFGPYNGITIGC